jgi:hypothetical protein
MNKDEMIVCPKSKGNACYVTEITKDIKQYFSFSCGYWSNSLMKENSDFYNEQISSLPEIYKDLAWKDEETDLIWLPTTINIEDKGMIFANGSSADNWKWAAVKAVEIKEEEKEKYPIKTKPGQFYKYRMDMSTMKIFDENDFIEALDYIQAFKNQL